MTVCCITPTADRQTMTARAIDCFISQTHEDKRLIVLDTGTQPFGNDYGWWKNISHVRVPPPAATLGELRNLCIELAGECDLIAHFDDDDWSHPNRLAEQVELIESTGADIVGYRDMLFYDSSEAKANGIGLTLPKDALWLYTAGRSNNHMGCGTSYMYRRSVWEKRPFPAVTVREDETFLYRIPVEKRMFVSSLGSSIQQYREPRMIAEIHGANTIRNRSMSAQNWAQIVDEPMIADVRKMLGY